MKTTTTNARLAIRLIGHVVHLECLCGYAIVQPQRAPIEPQCPRCRRRWRR